MTFLNTCLSPAMKHYKSHTCVITACENDSVGFTAADFLQEFHLGLSPPQNSKTCSPKVPVVHTRLGFECSPSYSYVRGCSHGGCSHGGRVESELCSPVAVILLVICRVKTWDLTLQGAANDRVTQGQLLLNFKCHFSAGTLE